MKIIKNAMTTPTEMTCPECKSVLEYTYNDISRREENTVFGFYSGVKRYIVCPVCKTDINLSLKINEAANEDQATADR